MRQRSASLTVVLALAGMVGALSPGGKANAGGGCTYTVGGPSYQVASQGYFTGGAVGGPVAQNQPSIPAPGYAATISNPGSVRLASPTPTTYTYTYNRGYFGGTPVTYVPSAGRILGRRR